MVANRQPEVRVDGGLAFDHLGRAGNVDDHRLQMILQIVEEDGADVIVVHSFQIDEVRLVRVSIHLGGTVGVNGTATEADAIPVQPVRHLSRSEVLPCGDDSVADLVGQIGDGLFDGHRLRIDRDAGRPRLQDGGGMRVRGGQDDLLKVDGTVLLCHRVSDRFDEDFRQLQEVQRDEGRRNIARLDRDNVGGQRGIRFGRKPQAELSPQGDGFVRRDVDRRGSDLQFSTVQQGWKQEPGHQSAARRLQSGTE